jgi:DNA-binding NarL/FixJ family response regulator
MRFLLLDDEKVSRFTLRQVVQTIPGATIDEAEHAAQARERLASLTAPAVCIFDVRLPDESGLDLLAWVRGQPRYQAFPVLLYTGNDDADTRQRAASLRVEGYLSKPPDQGSAQRVAAVATQLSEDLLPDPRALALRLGTSPARLASYIDALEKQIAELGQMPDGPARQAVLAKCIQVGKALGSRYLLQVLQNLQTVAPGRGAEWMAAAALALGGMRARLKDPA